MKINEQVIYEKMGNEVYLNIEDDSFVLDNEVSIYIFDLLKVEQTPEGIKQLVREKFPSTEEFTDEEKEEYIDEFLFVLQKNHIIH
ncbi:hypothetical protein A5844_000931 [Enterococcus sp. 10A9_DIV0425]|uniref:PqqD family protein n=1 Tax=Candidatus Enterococcus wittei TaxID=1987383 RepID=A0A242JZF5_9ENTE|nr:hypothetical protein [Enterococcus sp. 10A9_DIV0425]OTP10797.1 hypothetical protein A5844_000931 [Enterococcus sp. 10A9_DIV0425]THE08288.1 hypothetical protein E1H99_11865 [Enterococcus hirae]